MKPSSIAVLFLVIWCTATAHRAAALTFTEVEVTCPLDGTMFTTTLATSGTARGSRLDGKPLGPMAAPWPVAVCPTDHFVLYKSTFDPDEIATLRPFVHSPAYQDQVPGNSSYYLMALIFEVLGKSPKTIAHTYLQASWQVESEHPETYRHYVAKSLETFERFLAHHQPRDQDALSVEVLCAELERRLSRFDQARERLARVTTQFAVERSRDKRIIAYELELIDAQDRAPHPVPDIPEERQARDFVRRGNLLFTQGLYDHAIEHYDHALRLQPDDAKAFTDRAEAYFNKALYNRAIEDLDRAIRLEPGDDEAPYLRGMAHFHLGHFPEAARDYERSLSLYAANLFGHLWLYLARERAGQDGRQELARHATTLDLHQWPGPVVSLFLGHATPEQVMAAVQPADPRTQRERACEAFFYIGQHYLLRGDRDKAARLFRQALDSGVPQFVEYTGASVELERLGDLNHDMRSRGSVGGQGDHR